MKKLFKQIIRFSIVGICAFIIDYTLLYILTEYLNIYYFYSSIISFLVSLTFNYVVSIKWVFKVNKKTSIKDFLVFIILSIIGLFINQIIMYIMVEKVNVYYMISKLCSTIIVMLWNFVTRKIFIEK